MNVRDQIPKRFNSQRPWQPEFQTTLLRVASYRRDTISDVNPL